MDFEKAISTCLLGLKDSTRMDSEELIALYNLLGASYIRIRSLDKAFAALSYGLFKSNRMLPAVHPSVGDLHYNLGLYFDRAGKGNESLGHHLKALEIRLGNLSYDDLKVADSYMGLGEVYLYTIGNVQKAKLYFEKAVMIRERRLASDDFDLYTGYFYLAQVSNQSGDFDKALSFAFKALSIVNSKKEYLTYREKCFTLLGDVYYSNAEFDKSIKYLTNGISQSSVDHGVENYNLIKKYTHLGAAYGEIGKIDSAIWCFKKSLAIFKLHHHHNAQLEAENFLHLGRTFQKSGNQDSSLFFLNKYLKARLKDYGPSHSRTSEAFRYLAKYFQMIDQADSAEIYIQKALVAAIPGLMKPTMSGNPSLALIQDRHDLFQIFGDKGSIYLDKYAGDQSMYSLVNSLECLKLSDTLMQLSRNSYHQEGAKLFFADHYHHIYENALHAAWLLFHKTNDPGYFSDAIGFMEKSKAILLAESLNKAEIFTRAGLPDSVRELERNLNTALATYRSQLETATVDAQQRLHARIFEISQKQQRLLDTIADRYPSYFQIRYQKISTLPEIQEFSQKTNAAIIEFFWGEDKIFVLGISGKKIIFREINEVDSITQHVQRYFESLQHIPAWKDKNVPFEKFFKNSRRIYTELLAPVLEEMETEKLIIIRDGPLLMIPFESLVVSDKNSEGHDFQHMDYLLRHFTVSYAHSADLLLKNARQDLSAANSKVLAFSFSPLLVTANLSSSRGMNELPGAAREISAIAEVFPGTFLLGEDATEQKFKTLAPDFDILHLAVHGKSDPGKQFSGSLFFKNAQDDEEDGELHVYELYDLALKARLAVLSACESGAGKIFRGEGVFSIARGFAYAGCPSTVMTLWPVSDVASAQIMADFYSALSKGEDIDHSLRQAKLRYLRNADSYLAHPAYWAAYIPTGNMRAIVPPPAAPRLISALVGVAILLLTGYWLAKRKRRRIALDHMLNSRAC